MVIRQQDFNNPSEEIRKKLAILFKSNPDVSIWEPGKYDDITLECTIVKHANSRIKQQNGDKLKFRYEVLNNTPNYSGKISEIYKSNYTLALDDGEINNIKLKVRKSHQLRLIKVQKIIALDGLEKMKKECHFMEDTSFYHCKPIVVNEDESKTYMIFKYLPGVELFEIIVNNNLPLLERFDLSIELLTKYETQIFKRGLFHFDIKPENVLVYKSNGKFVIYIIDYGFMMHKEALSEVSCGSPHYIAPEMFVKSIKDEKSDIYSLARVLMYLWNDYDSETRKAKTDFEEASDPGFENLFTDMEEHLCFVNLLHIFKEMCSLEPSSRPDITSIIALFKALRAEVAEETYESSTKHQRVC